MMTDAVQLTTPFTPVTALSKQRFPYYSGGVKAGFPSPAQDFMGEKIDLNELVIRHPSETFFTSVSGNSMRDAGIHDGDLVVVDRNYPPQDGNIYVVYLNGEFTLKRLRIDKCADKVWLQPENEAYPAIEVRKEDDEVIVWGRVTFVIKKF